VKVQVQVFLVVVLCSVVVGYKSLDNLDDVEKAISMLLHEAAEGVQQETVRIFRMSKKLRSTLSRAK
jgi:hypothetical protein